MKPIDTRLKLKYKGVVVGKALVRDYKDGEIFLTDFVLDPQWRGMSLGRKFMQKLISNYGVNSLTVNPENSRAFNLYKSFGFKTVGNAYFDKNANETVLYMKRHA